MNAYSVTRGKRNYQQVFLYHLKTALTAIALQPFSQKFTTFIGSVYYKLQTQYIWPEYPAKIFPANSISPQFLLVEP